MNERLMKRNLEESVQNFYKSKKVQISATGSNKWWEDRILKEPINM